MILVIIKLIILFLSISIFSFTQPFLKVTYTKKNISQTSNTIFNTRPSNITENVGGIINDYTPVLDFDICINAITVENSSAFNVGDTVLIIQMKGAVIDSSNTSNFGIVTDYKNAGNYEFNYIKSKNGNTIELKNVLLRQYDIPNGKVQLIRVPWFQDAVIANTLTCLPWDGQKGGVLVLNTANTITLNSNIDVSYQGFKGGNAVRNPLYNCNIDSFYLKNNNGINGNSKGEGVYFTNDLLTGRGKLANGGGGGNSTNAGGAGGGNSGVGGAGGKQYVGTVCNNNFSNGGVGGMAIPYSNAENRIFLGGGGGAGQEDDSQLSPGGNGGGIAIIICNTIVSNGFLIKADGETPLFLIGTNDDGRSGGGAGGTVLLKYNTISVNLQVSVKGGNGDNCVASPLMNLHGPGGGGGGGIVLFNKPTIENNLLIDFTAGINGVNINQGNNPWGATAGTDGNYVKSVTIPFASELFKPNIDSVKIKDSLTSCDSFDFKGLAFTNTNPIATWQWFFGDGQSANTQNTSHAFAPGSYVVKLIVTDINGCKDSISRNVSSTLFTVDAGSDSTICNGQSVLLQSSSTGATQFLWFPANFLNNSTIQNPIATPPPGTTVFYVTATSLQGCSKTDSLTITVRASSLFNINAPMSICIFDSVKLFAEGGDTYLWQPLAGINVTIPDPFVAPQTTTTFTVTITDTLCNVSQNLSTTVTINPLPGVKANKSNDIDCNFGTAQLSASGALQYSWSPAATLSNASSSSPTARPTATTQYIVRGTDPNGCKNYDSVIVKVDFSTKGNFLVPNAFTPNNDGLNDCFGPKYWGSIIELDFKIYNRWGQLVFHSNDPAKCWDGKVKGVKQNPGVFVYWIKAKSTCENEIFRKGTVVLIR